MARKKLDPGQVNTRQPPASHVSPWPQLTPPPATDGGRRAPRSFPSYSLVSEDPGTSRGSQSRSRTQNASPLTSAPAFVNSGSQAGGAGPDRTAVPRGHRATSLDISVVTLGVGRWQCWQLLPRMLSHIPQSTAKSPLTKNRLAQNVTAAQNGEALTCTLHVAAVPGTRGWPPAATEKLLGLT